MPKASHLYRSGTISRKTDKPTHPEKLLWAANGFQESRYYVSVKQMWKKKNGVAYLILKSTHQNKHWQTEERLQNTPKI